MVNTPMSDATTAPSQAAIGRALGLSPAAITKLKGQGMPVYSIEAAQAWRESRQNVAARKPLPVAATVAPARPAPPPAPDDEDDRVPDFQESRARREAADAALAELKVRKERGLLIEKAPVIAQFAKQIAAAREALLTIPARLAPILAAETDARRAQALLDAEIRTAINAITGGTP